MSDQDGGDRPRWEGFPGGVDPVDPNLPGGAPEQPPVDPSADYPTGPVPGWPGPASAPPAAPQFPVQPMAEETAPVPIVGATPVDPDGSGLGPRMSRSHAAARPDTSRYVAFACAAAVLLVGVGFGFVACNNDDVSTTGANAPVVPLTSPTTATPTPSSALTRSSAIPTTAPTKPSATTSARP